MYGAGAVPSSGTGEGDAESRLKVALRYGIGLIVSGGGEGLFLAL